jgi:hypothetical protein
MRFNFKLHRTNTSVVRTQFPRAAGVRHHLQPCAVPDARLCRLRPTVPVFSHGSLFVALSRARAAANVAIFVGSDNRALGDNDAASAVNVDTPS